MYRIYAKTATMRRYQALDVGRGEIVANLIYATFFYTRGEALRVLQDLEQRNPSILFDLRKV